MKKETKENGTTRKWHNQKKKHNSKKHRVKLRQNKNAKGTVYGNEIIGINGSSFFMAGEYFFSTFFFYGGRIFFFHGKSYSRVYFFMPRGNYRDVWLGCVPPFIFLVGYNSMWVSKMGLNIFGEEHWCLLFVLIRQGLRGGSGPQRLIRAPGIETGNPIVTFSWERVSHLECRSVLAAKVSPRIRGPHVKNSHYVLEGSRT